MEIIKRHEPDTVIIITVNITSQSMFNATDDGNVSFCGLVDNSFGRSLDYLLPVTLPPAVDQELLEKSFA